MGVQEMPSCFTARLVEGGWLGAGCYFRRMQLDAARRGEPLQPGQQRLIVH